MARGSCAPRVDSYFPLMLACPPRAEVEAVFLRAALLAEAMAASSEHEGREEEAQQQREVAAKARSLVDNLHWND